MSVLADLTPAEKAQLRDRIARARLELMPALPIGRACRGCGVAFDERTVGCRRCNNRHGRRALRADGHPPRNPLELTEAQLAAVELAKQGLTHAEIAERLGISPGAVNQRLLLARQKRYQRQPACSPFRAVPDSPAWFYWRERFGEETA